MSRIERSLAKLFLSLVTFGATFLAFELGARFYLNHFASISAFAKYASIEQVRRRAAELRFTPHRYIGFIPTPSYANGLNRHNAEGYRGAEIDRPKPAGQFRIACLGGSTTYTTDVEDWHLSYPAQLERTLREDHGFDQVRVINAGASSWASWESLVDLEFRLLDLEPDVIVVYHGINDVHPRIVWPPEAYRADNSGRRVATGGLAMPSILHYSTLLRVLLIRAGLAQPHSDLDAAMGGSAPTYFGDEFERQVMEGRYPDGIFDEVSAQRMLDTNKPIYYRSNLEHTVALARHHGIEVVFATFAYSPLFEDQPRVASPEYRSAYAETNEVTADVARETGAHLFDFAAVFPQDKRYYTDGRHVNEEGALLKARLFAQYLIREGLLPASTPLTEAPPPSP